MRRRDFIKVIAGSAAAWPLAAHAQQPERMRRIGVLVGQAENDPDTKARLTGFQEALAKAGWSEGRNVSVDYRFAAGRAEHVEALAKELVALQPDVIIAQGTSVTAALQRESNKIPIVFVTVSDPIGSGFVASLPRPGGNMTGLLQYEAGIVGKWMAMLKEIAPSLAHVALVANPKVTAYDYFLRAAQAAAPSLAIEIVPSPIESAGDIERVIDSVARVPNSGLLLPPDPTTITHRDLIVALAARHRLPAVYSLRIFITAGGLMSYGIDVVEIFRLAATYADRILRGATPAELPVQAPTKFETIVNLKTAKVLGLDVPPSLILRADEVIE